MSFWINCAIGVAIAGAYALFFVVWSMVTVLKNWNTELEGRVEKLEIEIKKIKKG